MGGERYQDLPIKWTSGWRVVGIVPSGVQVLGCLCLLSVRHATPHPLLFVPAPPRGPTLADYLDSEWSHAHLSLSAMVA